jgi:hypothetical protein
MSLTALLLTASLCTAGCVKKEDDSSSSEGATTAMKPFHTDCGTVIDSSLENPADPQDGIKGTVTVVGGNLLIMKPEKGGDVLIKLHALGVPSSQSIQSAAMNALKELAKEPAVFFPAGETCTTRVDTATGTVGQVFTASGKSYSEKLLNEGYARVESEGCDSSLIYACYQALEEEAAQNYAGEVEAFLWKPISDSNGKLAIHASPADTVITVNGETGQDFSGGNGYENLARFSKPGCSYGKNVTVKLTNTKGVPYRFAGKTAITIPDGCQRYCIRNGSLVSCPK